MSILASLIVQIVTRYGKTNEHANLTLFGFHSFLLPFHLNSNEFVPKIS